LSNHVVLIVEDDADTRDVLRTALESEGFTVMGAEDSVLALSALSSIRPDVIVVDLMLPRFDGISLIRWIRNDPESVKIPIVAMTAHGDFYLRQAERAGANLTVRKPEEMPDIPAMIKRLLGNGNSGKNKQGQGVRGY